MKNVVQAMKYDYIVMEGLVLHWLADIRGTPGVGKYNTPEWIWRGAAASSRLAGIDVDELFDEEQKAIELAAIEDFLKFEAAE